MNIDVKLRRGKTTVAEVLDLLIRLPKNMRLTIHDNCLIPVSRGKVGPMFLKRSERMSRDPGKQGIFVILSERP